MLLFVYLIWTNCSTFVRRELSENGQIKRNATISLFDIFDSFGHLESERSVSMMAFLPANFATYNDRESKSVKHTSHLGRNKPERVAPSNKPGSQAAILWQLAIRPTVCAQECNVLCREMYAVLLHASEHHLCPHNVPALPTERMALTFAARSLQNDQVVKNKNKN